MRNPSIKAYLPRSLFGRAVLIYLVPVLTILAVMSVVFVQRLYEDVTRQMTVSVADEIALVLSKIEGEDNEQLAIREAREIAAPLGIEFRKQAITASVEREWLDLSGITIVSTLNERFPGILAIDLVNRRPFVQLLFSTRHGQLTMAIQRSRFSARNPHQFLVLIGLTALFMTLIALLYLRGQVRPIRRLAAAATAFGKGRVVPYRISGAAEVRQAGQAFLEMRERIELQIEQRTMMLSGVSHDLRTPLTRMRLALSLLEDEEMAKDLSGDISEMETMLNAFLDFSRADALEDPELTDAGEVLCKAVERALKSGAVIGLGNVDADVNLQLRPSSLARALDNLIGNSKRYANRAVASFDANDTQIVFCVEDDGPGIQPEDREDAVKPFNRLDRARNQDAGSGVGLGLAIASDIARQHGGQLVLSNSHALGGLKAEIVLPR